MKLFLCALLVALNTYAADTLIYPKDKSNVYLAANDGNRYPVSIAYTTNGLGDLLTLLMTGVPASADSTFYSKNSGRAFIDANDGKRYPVTVLYTTDGNNNVVPLALGGGGGSVSLYGGADLVLNPTPITGAGTISIGTLGIARGGTGATTASDAINNLLPTQSGNSGRFLTTDGSVASWGTLPAGGSGANVNLSNLGTTAVNVSLEPGTNNTFDLGSFTPAGKAWNRVIANSFYDGSGANGVQMINGNDMIFNVTQAGGPGAFKFINANIDFDNAGNPSVKIINAADPSDPQDYATKNYVDTGFANVNLSNLGTTSISQDIVFAPAYSGSVQTSAQTGSNNSEDLLVYSGPVVDGKSGDTYILTGEVTGTGTRGTLFLGDATSPVHVPGTLTVSAQVRGNQNTNIIMNSVASGNGYFLNIQGGDTADTGANGGALYATAGSDGNGIPAQFYSYVSTFAIGGHLYVENRDASTPAYTVNANAGTGATCTGGGSDTVGFISLTTTSTASASGVQCEVIFGVNFANDSFYPSQLPRCQLTPTNAAAAQKSVSQGIYVSNNQGTLGVNFAVAEPTGDTYTFNYLCVQGPN